MDKCRHIYELVNANKCPDCGRDTHEINYETEQKIMRDYYSSGDADQYVCPQGGTIRGWWSI
jgi:predicted RNA-binding Zn-ribbon protein involved in translation (DUF1610 family)